LADEIRHQRSGAQRIKRQKVVKLTLVKRESSAART
jgi:hypothetical protein